MKKFLIFVCIFVFVLNFSVFAFADDEIEEQVPPETIQDFLDDSGMSDYSQDLGTDINVSYSDNNGDYLSITGDTETVEDLLNSALGMSTPDSSLRIMNKGVIQAPEGYRYLSTQLVSCPSSIYFENDDGDVPFSFIRDILGITSLIEYYQVFNFKSETDNTVTSCVVPLSSPLFFVCEVLSSLVLIWCFFRFVGSLVNKL